MKGEDLADIYKLKIRSSSEKLNTDATLFQSWSTSFSGHPFEVRIRSHTADAVSVSRLYEMICRNLTICKSSSVWQCTMVCRLESLINTSNDSQWRSDQVMNRHSDSNYGLNVEMRENWKTPSISKQAPTFHLLTLQTQHLLLLQHNQSSILLKTQPSSGVTLFRWANCSQVSYCLHLQRQAVHEEFLESVTSKKTCIFSNTAVRTSNLAFSSLKFLQFLSAGTLHSWQRE